MGIQTDTSAAISPTDVYNTTAVQTDIENALFGGPISQTAPDLATVASATSTDPTADAGLSDSSQTGNMDYSFYTDPGSQPLPSEGYTDLSSGDPVSDFYNQLPTVDLTQFDSSDSGAVVNPDGSISMP